MAVTYIITQTAKKRKDGFIMVKVENMVSNSSGREIVNQFIIRDGNKIIFQSYNSIIAVIDNDKNRF